MFEMLSGFLLIWLGVAVFVTVLWLIILASGE